MKKILLILMTIFVTTFTSYAQITTIVPAEKIVEPKEIQQYDATKNFLGTENVETYVGQILYVNGISEQLQGYGYDDFKTTKVRHYDNGNRYGNPSIKSPYNTKYEDLFGKYFKVLNVDKDETLEGCYVFTLQNRDNENDILYFNYNGRFELTFPFIVVSHFEWVKQNLIGKKFIYNCGKETDIITGQELNLNYDDTWECIDVTIETKYYNLVMLLKNKNGNVVSYDIQFVSTFNNNGSLNKLILLLDEYQKLVAKYGKTMIDKVRSGDIIIGMSKELLIMSWGEPDKINYNSYGANQWVYGSQCVYVKNGKVEGWN